MTDNLPDAVSQDSKNMAMLGWILTIFFGFIPGLVLYLVKTEDAYVKSQALEALNWSITTMIAYLIGFFLMLVLIGFAIVPAVGICNLVFCIMGAVACSEGKAFRVPFALRFIK
jgi:uncharacterized protein